MDRQTILMIDEKILRAVEKEYQDYISSRPVATQKHYLYWFSKFPHSQFLEALDKGSEEAENIIKRFLFKPRRTIMIDGREEKTNWDNSVCRGFLLSYLKCFEWHKKIEIPERKDKKTKKKKIKPSLSKNEIDKISRVFKSHFKFRYWLAFNLMYHGALRQSELNSIRINSFQWEIWWDNIQEDCALIVRGKGNKERFVLIPPNIVEALVEYLLNEKFWPPYKIRQIPSNDDPLFRFGKNTLYINIVRASKRALGKKINPHLVRHSKATHLLDMGAEIKDIQNYLGHSNLATTEVYLHRSQKQSLENIKQLEKNNGS